MLARWPEDVSNATLRRAASRVRFQLGQADKFQAGLIRMGRWSDHIERVLEEHGVPRELVALPHVESSYNPRAYSRVGAAGLWQFTRSTGRRYLRVDHVVDERMDPFKASDAAARLLRDNHRAARILAAGDHRLQPRRGGHGARRAEARHARHRSHRAALSEPYLRLRLPQLLRGVPGGLGDRPEAERYFGALQPDAPDRVHDRRDGSLLRGPEPRARPRRRPRAAARPQPRAATGGVERREARAARLPAAGPADALEAPVELALAKIPEDERMAKQHRDRFHKVQRGETLSKIARRYGVQESELVALNNLRSRHRIRAGQVLRLPDDGRAHRGGPQGSPRRRHLPGAARRHAVDHREALRSLRADTRGVERAARPQPDRRGAAAACGGARRVVASAEAARHGGDRSAAPRRRPSELEPSADSGARRGRSAECGGAPRDDAAAGVAALERPPPEPRRRNARRA